MKMKSLGLSLAVVTAFSLGFSGCGGGDDSTATATPTDTTQTGTFVDAPVKGLSIITASGATLTDDKGQFSYKTGDECEFKLGTLSLGKATCGSLMTPYTLAGVENGVENTKATNIAMLLQNFDGVRGDSRLLDVSKLKDYDFSAFDLSKTNDEIESSLTTLLATGTFQTAMGGEEFTPITADVAKNYMKTYVENYSIKFDKKFTDDYIEGKTFYAVFLEILDEGLEELYIGNTKERFYNENQTPSNELTGYKGDGNMFRVVDGKLYQYTSENGVYNDGVNIFTITDIDSEKITTTMKIDSDTYDVHLYFDEAEAQLNTVSIENGFGKDWLTGKTFYIVANMGEASPWMKAVVVFNTDGSMSINFESFDISSSNNDITYTIDENGVVKSTLTNGDITENEVLDMVLKEATFDYLKVQISNQSINYYYYMFLDIEKAEEKFTTLSAGN